MFTSTSDNERKRLSSIPLFSKTTQDTFLITLRNVQYKKSLVHIDGILPKVLIHLIAEYALEEIIATCTPLYKMFVIQYMYNSKKIITKIDYNCECLYWNNAHECSHEVPRIRFSNIGIFDIDLVKYCVKKLHGVKNIYGVIKPEMKRRNLSKSYFQNITLYINDELLDMIEFLNNNYGIVHMEIGLWFYNMISKN